MASHASCGTEAGARRHYRRGEKPCPSCMHASRMKSRERRGSDPWNTGNGEQALDLREVRNGLPEFRPYRWRGRERQEREAS